LSESLLTNCWRITGQPDVTQSEVIVTRSMSSLTGTARNRLAFNRIVVLRYRSHLESRQLAPDTINLRLGAVRRLAYEAADCGLLSADLAAGIRGVKGAKKLGIRLGNWLTAEQGDALWQAPDRCGCDALAIHGLR
jgi:hypothetical protein